MIPPCLHDPGGIGLPRVHPCRDHHSTARLESCWVATEGGDGDQIAGVPRQGVAELAPPQAADHVGVLS